MASAALLSSFSMKAETGVSCQRNYNNTHEKLLLHREWCNRNRLQNYPRAAKFSFLKTKAAKKDDSSTKPKSVVCVDCDGNGAIQCSQCKGSGLNSEDLFNGRFKAGDTCWLCGGKKDMLCGGCNGAGFLGGFMSTFDE